MSEIKAAWTNEDNFSIETTASEYIKREDILEKLQGLWFEIHDLYGWNINSDCKIGIDESMRAVASIPSADVEPIRHGRWERLEEPFWTLNLTCRCQICGWTVNNAQSIAFAYCPSCGAKMDGKSDE